MRSGELKTKHEQSVYGAEYEKALSYAMERRRKGESFQTIRDALATIYPLELLTDAGLTQIMEALKGY